MTYRATLPVALIQLDVPPPRVSAQIGEQAQWFIDALALQPEDYLIVRPHLGESLPAFDQVSGAILSGSWAMVTDHLDWSERTAAWVRGAVEEALPLFGVCYGHQLIAYALGGEVADNPRGWERGLLEIELTSGTHFATPLPARFPVWLSHRQSVVTAPQGAEVLACSQLEGCQILRYSPQALSVQFHPEFTQRIMHACLPADIPASDHAMPQPDWARQLLVDFWRQCRTPRYSTLPETAVVPGAR